VTLWAAVGLSYCGEVDEHDRPVYDGELAALVYHDPLGTESVTMDDATLPANAWTTGDWDELCRMVNSLIRHDRRLYPPFNPLPAKVADGRVTTLFVHADEGDDLGLVAKAAERYGLPTETAR
jgi:hypothetical protein